MPTTWFITGTSSGFGRLLTERLPARGDRVAATARRPEVLDDLRAQYGERLWPARLDVTHTEQAHQVVADAFKALGTIDAVVNNAGHGLFASGAGLGECRVQQFVAGGGAGLTGAEKGACRRVRSGLGARPTVHRRWAAVSRWCPEWS
ncbi:SDR family NAD(P)-dependent oxidoreductase [Streptomyces sp. NPDC096046]|uniref:SDR family NAD(P)-dependent oxidoreductase n=1 Tax=Streptomyces sp. NPDC096046 TaxID=3155542 RepID=UPI00332980F3